MYTIKFPLGKPETPIGSFGASVIQPSLSSGAHSVVAKAIQSPCVGICSLRADGLCEGCLRTSDEIGNWSNYSDEQRAHIMDALLPARES
jgi:uncharacterized protein